VVTWKKKYLEPSLITAMSWSRYDVWGQLTHFCYHSIICFTFASAICSFLQKLLHLIIRHKLTLCYLTFISHVNITWICNSTEQQYQRFSSKLPFILAKKAIRIHAKSRTLPRSKVHRRKKKTNILAKCIYDPIDRCCQHADIFMRRFITQSQADIYHNAVRILYGFKIKV